MLVEFLADYEIMWENIVQADITDDYILIISGDR
jgi:hypothetical protein